MADIFGRDAITLVLLTDVAGALGERIRILHGSATRGLLVQQLALLITADCPHVTGTMQSILDPNVSQEETQLVPDPLDGLRRQTDAVLVTDILCMTQAEFDEVRKTNLQQGSDPHVHADPV